METSLTSLAQNLEARQTMLGRLETLVNASPIAMFSCRAGGDFGTTFVTEGVRTLWGYEPEEFLRHPGFWADRIHPDDIAAVYGHLARVLERGTHSYDYRFRTKSGEYRWTHDELRLVKDEAGNPVEIAGYCFDITEQKLAEAALRESEARQKVIFNSTSDLQALFRVEPGNRFVTEAVNRALIENFQLRMGKTASGLSRQGLSGICWRPPGSPPNKSSAGAHLLPGYRRERAASLRCPRIRRARCAGGLHLSGTGPARKLHPSAVEWPQHRASA